MTCSAQWGGATALSAHPVQGEPFPYVCRSRAWVLPPPRLRLQPPSPDKKKPRTKGGRGFSEFSMHGNGGSWGTRRQPSGLRWSQFKIPLGLSSFWPKAQKEFPAGPYPPFAAERLTINWASQSREETEVLRKTGTRRCASLSQTP